MPAFTPSRAIVLAPLFALLAFLAGCGSEEREVVRREGEPDYVYVSDKALMERAMAKARETRQQFIDALAAPQTGWRGFTVKKGFDTPDGGHEHIWIADVRWDGQVFHGVVNNEPVDTTAVKLGDAVTVTPEELSDWMYIDGNRVVGGYTLRVLHYQSPPEEQREFLEQTGLEIPAIDF